MQRPISKSKLEAYFLCPAAYRFRYLSGLPSRTDFPRVLGIAVHRFVAKLHSNNFSNRPFYYKSKKSASSAWFGFYWKRVLNEFSTKLEPYTSDKADKYSRIGWMCINNYWNTMSADNRGELVEVEKRYTHHISPGVNLVGIIDQIRLTSLKHIKKIRPELIKGGSLVEGYLPYILVDIKTGMFDYNPCKVNTKDPKQLGRTLLAKELSEKLGVHEDTLSELLDKFTEDNVIYLRAYNHVVPDISNPDIQREVIRMQASFHLDIQATMYTLLFEQNWGGKPIGFLWYNINTNNPFFTYREDADYQDLFDQVDHFVQNVQANSYPKKPSRNCRWCDYVDYCRGNRDFLISMPTGLPQSSIEQISVENEVTHDEASDEEPKQLDMVLVIPRNFQQDTDIPTGKPNASDVRIFGHEKGELEID